MVKGGRHGNRGMCVARGAHVCQGMCMMGDICGKEGVHDGMGGNA